MTYYTYTYPFGGADMRAIVAEAVRAEIAPLVERIEALEDLLYEQGEQPNVTTNVQVTIDPASTSRETIRETLRMVRAMSDV